MKAKKQSNAGKILLEREIRPYRGRIFLLTFFTIGTTLFSLAFAYLVRYLINSASEGDSGKLWIFAAILLGTLLGKIVFKVLNGYYTEKVRSKMYTDLRSRTFHQILRSDYAKLQGYHSGNLINRLTGDVQEIAVYTVGLTPSVFGMAVQCLGAVVALLTIDPLFTAIYAVCGGIFGGLFALFRKGIKKRHKEVLEADGNARAFMQEGLSSIMTVKAYGAEGKASQKESALSAVYHGKRLKRNIFHAQMDVVFSVLTNFGVIFAVVWCALSVLVGDGDYGSIVSVILLLMQLQQPLTSFSSIMPAYYARQASAERLAELDSIPKEREGAEDKDLLKAYRHATAIVFDDLSFSYGRDAVLESANARIEKGKIVCLTGQSGAGKSTIFKLLLKVFQPTGGNLYLEGDFDESNALFLTEKERGLFAYVPQGNFLFSGTIYENLIFFLKEENVTDEEIRRALEVSCAEFVYELPEGLNTKLCEGGEGLSEGQQQRLNVARAILSNRPILLLDEATSALDGETEKKLLDNIRALKDKTCLIVTHRPAALAVADAVLTVESGKIVERN